LRVDAVDWLRYRPVVRMKEAQRSEPARQGRALEKHLSREADARALASGDKERDQLRRENGHFAGRKVQVDFKGAKSLW
jgi:hypothetical protein